MRLPWKIMLSVGVLAVGPAAGCLNGDVDSSMNSRAGAPAGTVGQERAEVFEFAEKPQIRGQRSEGGGQKWIITFASKTACDATVAVVDPSASSHLREDATAGTAGHGKDGKIIRHLASGVLGANAPEPFQKGTLTQSLEWDGTDDGGKPVPPGSKIRVSLELSASFAGTLGWDGSNLGAILGLAVGPGGELFVLNSVAGAGRLIVLGRRGEYLRTIMPPPASIPPEKLKGITFMSLTDGRRVPLLLDGPVSIVPQTAGIARQTPVITPTGRVLLIGAGPKEQKLLRMRTDGSIPDGIMGPTLWKDKGKGGYMAVAGDGRILVAASPLGKSLYIVDPDKGKAPALFARPEGQDQWEPRGVTTDSAGQVYLCDEKAGQVLVFTAGGKLIRALPAPGARLLAVHPKTGEIYVGSQAPGQLIKMAGMKSDSPHKVTARMEMSDVKEGRMGLALDHSADPAALWLTPDGRQLWRVEDAGEAFTKTVEVKSPGLAFVSQIALDRTRNELYAKVSREGQVARIDLKTGSFERLDVYANDMYCGPDGCLYVSRGSTYPKGYYPQFIRRFDRDGRPVPFPGGLKEIRVETEKRSTEGTDSGRGLFVAADGKIYLAGWDVYDATDKNNQPGPVRVFVYSPEGKQMNSEIIYGLPQGSCGLGVDRAGSIYVGCAVKPQGKACADYLPRGGPVPVDIRDKPWQGTDGRGNVYFAESGCLLKFPPAGGTCWWEAGKKMEQPPKVKAAAEFWRLRDRGVAPVAVEGALWWRFGVSPQRQGNDGRDFELPGGSCVCRSSRLDVDAFGRVFVPDALTFGVRVFDSAGNQVACIGGYGNADSRGPSSSAPEPEIGNGGVRFLAAGEDELYLSDETNLRIVRVKLRGRAEMECEVP